MTDIEYDLKAGNFIAIKSSLSTVYHEITHWADTVGTLWGNEYLKDVYAAYDVMGKINVAGFEEEFYRFMILHDNSRRLSYSDYYRTIKDNGKKHTIKNPWKIQFSCGVEFNPSGTINEKRPVIFVKFGDCDTEQQLVRQPLSVAALLETTATWSELSIQFLSIQTLDQDEMKVEETLLKKEYGERLYEPNLTLYSAPVHLLAHYTKIQNAIVAHHMGAMLSLVCLNLVGSHFRKLKTHKDIEIWGNRITAFKKNESRPFAFLCICMNAPIWDENTTPMKWLNIALSNSNLPSYDEVLEHAVTVLANDKSYCKRPRMAEKQKYLRGLGADWLAWRKEQEDPAIDFRSMKNSELHTPVIFDADEKACLLFDSNFNTKLFDPIAMYKEEGALHTQIINFRKACR